MSRHPEALLFHEVSPRLRKISSFRSWPLRKVVNFMFVFIIIIVIPIIRRSKILGTEGGR